MHYFIFKFLFQNYLKYHCRTEDKKKEEETKNDCWGTNKNHYLVCLLKKLLKPFAFSSFPPLFSSPFRLYPILLRWISSLIYYFIYLFFNKLFTSFILFFLEDHNAFPRFPSPPLPASPPPPAIVLLFPFTSSFFDFFIHIYLLNRHQMSTNTELMISKFSFNSSLISFSFIFFFFIFYLSPCFFCE